MSSCSSFSVAPVEGNGTLLKGMRCDSHWGISSSMLSSPPVVTGFTKYCVLKAPSSSSVDVSEELPSPWPVQSLEEGRVLSEHPPVKGKCHMTWSCDSLLAPSPTHQLQGRLVVDWGVLFVYGGSYLHLSMGFAQFELGVALDTSLLYPLIHPHCTSMPKGTRCSHHLCLLWCSHTCSGPR